MTNKSNATTDGPTHASCLFSGSNQIYNDVWFNFPCTFDGTLDLSTCGSTGDTKFAVYEGSGCTSFDTRILGCNDDAQCAAVNTLQSFLNIPVQCGHNYTIRVGNFANNAGSNGNLILTAHQAAQGSCCAATGSCTSTYQTCCAGTWTSGGVCSPNPCQGACCCGSNCAMTAASACTGAGVAFSGAGTVCTPYSATAPCCRGDYNKSGAVSVQDIFDFLAAYFANSPCADSNDTAAISVQDIFDFLAAYFGGC